MYFADSNVLVYAFDIREPERRLRAQAVFARHRDFGDVWASTQVLQEFYSAATWKFRLGHERVIDAFSLIGEFNLVVIDVPEISRAIELESVHRVSFWDSLILSAAITARVSVLYSEHFQHDREYSGVRVINPFLQ